MGKRVTLADIARECGVTKGLVSRALAGKYNVGDDTRNRIMRKAVELGYNFDKLRAKSRAKKSVLLVISNHILLKEDFWQPIIKEFYATLNRDSIKLEYFVFDKDAVDAEMIRSLKENPCIAFIFIHQNPDSIFEELKSTNKPIIEVDPKYLHPSGSTTIKFSNYKSMYEATQLLINKGHKTICFYGSDFHSMSFRERHEGFLACIDNYKAEGVRGISVIFDNTNQQYSDNEMLKKALKLNKDITAIVCANDICALNVYQIVGSMGKSIPEDYSIVGFDNIQKGMYIRPSLSTFNVPREQIGNEIGRYIVRLTRDDLPQYSEVIIRCEFIERESIREIGKGK